MTSPDGAPVTRDSMLRRLFDARPARVAEFAQPASGGPVQVRRFPFPFRYGVAISNDSRGTSEEALRDIHSAFAERGLELGATLSFGEGDGCSVSSGLATECHAAGLLDGVAGLPEEGAAAAARMIDAAGFAPACYIGNPPIAEAAPLVRAGLRYFTDPGFSTFHKYAEAAENRSTGALHEVFRRFDFNQIGAGGGTDLDRVIADVAEPKLRAFALALFDSATVPVSVGSGATLNAFKRFRGDHAPSAPSLTLQLRSHFLDQLEMHGAATIVEQRLGDFALLGQHPAKEQRRPLQPPVFTIHELLTLDDLAARETALVTTPGRLLDWLSLRSGLVFSFAPAANILRIEGVRDGASVRGVGVEGLDGLAFTIPADLPPTTVEIAGRPAALEMAREADPAKAGHDCLYRKWEKRTWPAN